MAIDRYYCAGKSVLYPLLDGTSSTKREPEKKDPLRGSFFSYRPLAGAHQPSAGAAPRLVSTKSLEFSSLKL